MNCFFILHRHFERWFKIKRQCYKIHDIVAKSDISRECGLAWFYERSTWKSIFDIGHKKLFAPTIL